MSTAICTPRRRASFRKMCIACLIGASFVFPRRRRRRHVDPPAPRNHHIVISKLAPQISNDAFSPELDPGITTFQCLVERPTNGGAWRGSSEFLPRNGTQPDRAVVPKTR